MKKSLPLLFILLGFASFATGNEALVSEKGTPSHEEESEGKMISFETPGGSEANAYYIASRTPSNKWLFIYHGWWGLDDNTKKQAQEYYESLDEINILAVDLYDGKEASDKQEAGEYMRGIDEQRVQNIVQGAIEHAGSGADIAVMGWSFGGTWALETAIMLGDQADGCVMFYGMPKADVEDLSKLHTPVLGIFADNDAWVTEEKVEEFRVQMKEADKKLELITFNASHSFLNTSDENYNRVIAGKARSAAVDFIRGHLNVAD